MATWHRSGIFNIHISQCDRGKLVLSMFSMLVDW